MEFYKSLSLEFYAKTIVSIPNGMEFYTMLDNTINYAIGFNSQRDGILLKNPGYCLFHDRFNSQRDGILQKGGIFNGAEADEFQFPTGWNSTCVFIYYCSLIRCFNSQRDGILRSYGRHRSS